MPVWNNEETIVVPSMSLTQRLNAVDKSDWLSFTFQESKY